MVKTNPIMKPQKNLTRRSKKPRKAGRSKTVGESEDIQRITESVHKNELVIVVGTGVSLALTDAKIPALSWKGLIGDGFSYGKTKGLITPTQVSSWRAQLESSDLDDLLGAAEFVSRKLSAPNGDLYARWLEKIFKTVGVTNREMKEALRAVQHAEIPICTLNYDHLLETVTGLPSVTLSDPQKVTAWMRRETQGILHLHGAWDSPATCILGIRDYETTIANDVRDLIQRSLGTFKRLLFIGCGDTFADPNFTALIRWLREKMKTAAPQHYAVVTNSEVAARHADPAWRGFVEPIGYGEKRADLPGFLKKHIAITGVVKSQAIAGRKNTRKFSERTASLLQQYRSFLIKDCGQMTIEGVRADMEIGQRRFDLEQLFVPLKVVPTPPEISKTDPLAEQKLRKWEKENKTPVPFGKVFGKNKHLALLALPGGGKTLLLKRLAVAYADTQRLQSTEDSLPDLRLTPILIRCREWREHIRKPILTLLQSVAEITGQADLVGLRDALLPKLRDGGALLLIDGLDEIHVDADRATFVEHLESFLEDFPRVRLVVTSREAGFSLVAPSISRFCARWRVAPLEDQAIKLLCENWRSLMSGDSPDAVSEMNEVIDHLIENASLHRLAENPLLLTMLLVVKHGAGRLPPDRVSLYSRAVEVLLDTWNIKGHDPLNLKESVPQLACVAFQLMKTGKQTATERELLLLLEEARDRIPQIQRYAKDSPYDFLKRVELRSSLLLEAGHQIESGSTVPFYQFRHLTFQEYLAAVAVAEGHYVDYSRKDTVLTPLGKYLTADEWKEVVPMAAVLARKQAEPLMLELLHQGQTVRDRLEKGEQIETEDRLSLSERLPAPVSRLVQCLVEEAEATPETTTQALQLISFFARGCHTQDDWRALSKGPYGAELLHHSWNLFSSPQSKELDSLNTCTYIAAARFGKELADKGNIDPELLRLITSTTEEEIAQGLFIVAGRVFERQRRLFAPESHQLPGELIEFIEKHFYEGSTAITRAAIWAWAVALYYCKIKGRPTVAALDQLLKVWLTSPDENLVNVASTALRTQFGLERKKWTPVLHERDVEKIRRMSAETDEMDEMVFAASMMVAFHAGTVWSDDELFSKLSKYRKLFGGQPERHEAILKQLKPNHAKRSSKRTPRQSRKG
jgi:SIR2-like protein/NACHT domain-containing protein